MEGSISGGLYDFRGEIVTKIYSEKLPENESSEEDEDLDGPESRIYEYDMEVVPIRQEWKKFVFSSKKELHSSFPLFAPQKIFDWSQGRGRFSCFMSDKFGWLMKDGKYSLDPETYDRIRDGFSRNGEMGYHDLILTAEAIKQKAWKVLSYRGLEHLPQFLNDFPESRVRYERAVWDSQTSLYAKHVGMTTSEFLRWRQGVG